MNLDEVKFLKHEMELKIISIIQEFEDKTGLSVNDISIISVEKDDGSKTAVLLNTDIKL